MRKTEARQHDGGARKALMLLLGALLALGIELIVLLLGSVAVSAGILRTDTETQVTAAACLLGCFIGGSFACAHWDSKRLLAGLLSGLICFALILLVALILGDGLEIGTKGLIELAGCVVGGGLAGVLAGRKKKKKRKAR